MSERIPATRLNRLRVRRRAQRTRRGLDLLRGKREALVAALLATARESAERRGRLDDRVRGASEALARAAAAHGLAGLESFAWAARRDLALEARTETVWGVRVAAFEPRPLGRDFRERGFDAPAAGPAVNRAADRFEALLESILETAAVEARLKRLGEEIRKTTRRINALEEHRLPALRAAEKRIRERLDEAERDEVHRLRRLKARRVRGPRPRGP